jgi:hypothetical protein
MPIPQARWWFCRVEAAQGGRRSQATGGMLGLPGWRLSPRAGDNPAPAAPHGRHREVGRRGGTRNGTKGGTCRGLRSGRWQGPPLGALGPPRGPHPASPHTGAPTGQETGQTPPRGRLHEGGRASPRGPGRRGSGCTRAGPPLEGPRLAPPPMPRMFEGMPRMFEGMPRMFEGMPRMLEEMPRMLKGMPRVLEDSPRILEDSPRTLEDSRHLDCLPQGFRRHPAGGEQRSEPREGHDSIQQPRFGPEGSVAPPLPSHSHQSLVGPDITHRSGIPPALR